MKSYADRIAIIGAAIIIMRLTSIAYPSSQAINKSASTAMRISSETGPHVPAQNEGRKEKDDADRKVKEIYRKIIQVKKQGPGDESAYILERDRILSDAKSILNSSDDLLMLIDQYFPLRIMGFLDQNKEWRKNIEWCDYIEKIYYPRHPAIFKRDSGLTTHSPCSIYAVYRAKGDSYYELGEYKNSVRNYEKAIEILKSYNQSQLALKSYSYLNYVYQIDYHSILLARALIKGGERAKGLALLEAIEKNIKKWLDGKPEKIHFENLSRLKDDINSAKAIK